MADENAHPLESRTPLVADLVAICRSLNDLQAESEIQVFDIDGVPIPFASPTLLLRTKQTHREKDAEDRMFLEHKLAAGR